MFFGGEQGHRAWASGRIRRAWKRCAASTQAAAAAARCASPFGSGAPAGCGASVSSPPRISSRASLTTLYWVPKCQQSFLKIPMPSRMSFRALHRTKDEVRCTADPAATSRDSTDWQPSLFACSALQHSFLNIVIAALHKTN